MKKTTAIKMMLSFIVIVLLSVYLVANYRIHSVIGTSMNSLYDTGDFVLLKKTKTIQRQQVVAFWYKSENEQYMKRIIGLPGDELLLLGNQLMISLDRKNAFDVTYQLQVSNEIAKELAGLQAIPEDYYFVLGDNLSVSNDSRLIGLIHKNEIIGEIVYRF